MRFLFYLGLSLFVISCQNDLVAGNGSGGGEAESPDIQLQLQGAPAGEVALIAMFAGQNYKLDSATVDESGHIRFQREEPYPQGLVYVLLQNNSYVQLLIDQDQTFTFTGSAPDFVMSGQVEGSLTNQLFYDNLRYEQEYQQKLAPINQQLQGKRDGDPGYAELKKQQQALVDARNAELQKVFSQHPGNFYTIFKKAGQNPELTEPRLADGSIDQARQVYDYRTAFWNDVDFSDERLLRTPVISNKLERYVTQLTAQNPDSIRAATDFLMEKVDDHPEYYKYFANAITLKYEPTKTTLMDSEAIYVHMVQNYFTYDKAFWSDSVEVYGLQLRASEMAQSLVGQQAPMVTVPGTDGKARALADLKAPYVVVYLYNPTCEHCIEQTPKLVSLYRQTGGQVFDVYGIAIDTEEAEWKDYIAKTGMPWTNVFDPTNRSIYKTYYVDNTPEIYVLDPERRIIAKNLKVNQIMEVIERDMNQRK